MTPHAALGSPVSRNGNPAAIGASYRPGQERWARGLTPRGGSPYPWGPALLLALHAAGPCHGTELGRGSRTARQTGNCFFREGSQSCALRLPGIEDCGRAATLCWPTPGPSWWGRPWFWSQGQNMAAGGATRSSSSLWPLVLSSGRCSGGRGAGPEVQATPLCPRTHRTHCPLFPYELVLSPLLG